MRLENRSQLVTVCEMGLQVFLNCAGFIRIEPSDTDNNNKYEVLDGTRIHPETYDWPRKMAVDALEYDDVSFCIKYLFYQLFGWPKANFGLMMEKHPHSPNVKIFFILLNLKITRSLVARLGTSTLPSSSLELESFWCRVDVLSHSAIFP